jgi:hypothetical protein
MFTAEPSNHRHGLLLRVSRELPSDSTAQNTEKFAPPHVRLCSASLAKSSLACT